MDALGQEGASLKTVARFLSSFLQQKLRHTLFLGTPYQHSLSASLQVRLAFILLPQDRECRILTGIGLLKPM